MSYQDEQDRLFDDIELRTRLAATLERRKDLALEFRNSGVVLSEKGLEKLKKIGRAHGVDDDTFMERVMRVLIDNQKKNAEPEAP